MTKKPPSGMATPPGLEKEQRSLIESVLKDILESDLPGQYGGHTLKSLREQQEGHNEDLAAAMTAEQPRDISEKHLPTIVQNLSSIRSTAESATHAIMNATENIQGLLGMLDEKMEQLIRKELTLIVQACAFQDLTGQQMTRIVDSVEAIEFAVDGILSAMGDKNAQRRYKEIAARRTKEKTSGKKTLSGPQNIIVKDKQAEIDNIFDA